MTLFVFFALVPEFFLNRMNVAHCSFPPFSLCRPLNVNASSPFIEGFNISDQPQYRLLICHIALSIAVRRPAWADELAGVRVIIAPPNED